MKTKTSSDWNEPIVVGAFEAKTHLAKFLRQARSGKRIVITQRGKPIAEMGPVNETMPQKSNHWGDLEGKIWISDDFCDELLELKEFFT